MATYYFDYVNGNDSWTGLAPNFTTGSTGPFKTLAKLPILLATGVVSAVDKWIHCVWVWKKIGSFYRLFVYRNGFHLTDTSPNGIIKPLTRTKWSIK